MQENGLLDGVVLPAAEDFAWQDLDCPYRGDLNRRFSYLFSMNGPTILLFRPKMDLREWIANPDHIQKEPESFNTLKYLHIPADWVLDIANFVSSTSTVAYTRVPSFFLSSISHILLFCMVSDHHDNEYPIQNDK